MFFLDLTLPSLAENLALDEALLLDAEAGGPEILRVWEWPTAAVILGAGGKLAEDVDEAACLRDAVPLARRSSGGGTVLIGPGCLLFSLVLAYERDFALTEVRPSYRYILSKIADSLEVQRAAGFIPAVRQDTCNRTAQHGGDEPRRSPPHIQLMGLSDLALGDRKFSGNAQQRKRSHLLHHGTLLYSFDLAGVSRYLKMPARQPEYRAGRGHAEFLMNLPAGVAALKEVLRVTWRADAELVDWPRQFSEKLLVDKFGKEEWVRRW